MRRQKSASFPARQRGVALIMAVLIVALATILAVNVTFRGMVDQRRSANLFALDQGETSETKTEPTTACAGAMGASTPTATKAAPHPRTTVLANLPVPRNLIERLPVQCVMHMP